MTSLLSKITLADLSDEQLRSTVGTLINKGALTEADVVLAAIAFEVAGETAAAGAQAGKTSQHTSNRGSKSGRGNGNGGAAAARKRSAKSGAAGSTGKRAADPSRALQGKYLAAIRRVPKGKRPAFSAIAKDKGREAAIHAINKQY